MENTKTNYDDLPVAACKYCNSLHIQIDDVENDVCMRCGSVNEIVLYKDIDDYLEKTKKDE
jgi:DNA-directed RNA polymerase subunit RPC12/RpoP